MRNILIILLLAVGALFAWQAVKSDETVADTSTGKSGQDQEKAQPPWPENGKGANGNGNGNGGGGENANASDTDELVDATFVIIRKLVAGEATGDDSDDFATDLEIILEEERIGDITTREEAARMTVDTIVKQVNQFRPAGATGEITITAMQERVMRSLAEGLAADMRDRLTLGLNADGQPHTGSFMAAIDVDLPKGYEKLSWRQLGGFEYKEGMELPKEVQALDGKKVGMAGYMMSLGEFTDVHNFLLVESSWSCCFGIPPDVHQVIVVRIPDDKPGVELTTMPVLCLGKLEVGEEKEGRWVTSVYRLVADEVQEIE